MTLAPNDLVYVSSPAGRSGEASYVRVRRDGRHVVRWVSDGAEHTCRPADAVRPLERVPVSPGEIVRPFEVTRLDESEVRAVPKDPPVRSESYKAWIRKQPCAWCSTSYPPGGREASHHPEPMGGRMAKKTDDVRCLPLCPSQHKRFTDTQAIGDMTPERTRAWAEARIVEHQTRYLRDVLGLENLDVDRAVNRALRVLLKETLERRARRTA